MAIHNVFENVADRLNPDRQAMNRLHWNSRTWQTPQGRVLQYQVADITPLMSSVENDGYTVELSKWHNTYSAYDC